MSTTKVSGLEWVFCKNHGEQWAQASSGPLLTQYLQLFQPDGALGAFLISTADSPDIQTLLHSLRSGTAHLHFLGPAANAATSPPCSCIPALLCPETPKTTPKAQERGTPALGLNALGIAAVTSRVVQQGPNKVMFVLTDCTLALNKSPG